jgi:hypothetical protein
MSEISELISALEKQTEALTSVVNEKKEAHTKAPANFQTATPLHGLGGIFSSQGIDRDVITAMVRPRGIASILPRIPTTSEDPRFASLTGYTDVTGSEPDNACEDAPQAYAKSCQLTAQFGMVRRDTQTIEMDQVMRRVNRGDFTDLRLQGRVLGMQDFSPSGLNENQILNIVTMSEMVGVGVQLERTINNGIWQSTAAGNWGWPGLNAQIATGQVDAASNTACPALDSDIKDFAYNDVCGTTLDIVEYVSMMEHYLNWNASSMGLDPVSWAIAMRPNLWYELSACWPCSYLSNRCQTAAGANVSVINDDTNVRMRDEMRNGNFIWINGKQYPVIQDTGIFEHNNANNANLNPGEFASSIYFVPMTILGNMPVTYLEYLDYRQASVDTSLLRGKEDFWWTDNGLFSWAIENNKWCYKLSAKVEPRVVLRTPQLAGRIQSIRYTPLQHLREPDPSSPYNYDGGVSIRNAGTRYAVWL